MPKRPEGRGWWAIAQEAIEGKGAGGFSFRHERPCAGTIGESDSRALRRLDWLVVCEIFPDETSEFWRAQASRRSNRPRLALPLRLPGAGFSEKPGTMVNSSRLLQWRDVANPPPGDARIDLETLAQIFWRVRQLYKTEEALSLTRF